MLLRRGHVGSGIGRVAERTGGEPRQLPRVPVLERDHHAVRGEGVEARQRIGCEARFRLLAVGDDRRTRGFHGRHGLRHRPLHGLAQTRVVKPAGAVRAHGVDEVTGAGNAADGFGANDHVVVSLSRVRWCGESSPCSQAGQTRASLRCWRKAMIPPISAWPILPPARDWMGVGGSCHSPDYQEKGSQDESLLACQFSSQGFDLVHEG